MSEKSAWEKQGRSEAEFDHRTLVELGELSNEQNGNWKARTNPSSLFGTCVSMSKLFGCVMMNIMIVIFLYWTSVYREKTPQMFWRKERGPGGSGGSIICRWRHPSSPSFVLTTTASIQHWESEKLLFDNELLSCPSSKKEKGGEISWELINLAPFARWIDLFRKPSDDDQNQTVAPTFA